MTLTSRFNNIDLRSKMGMKIAEQLFRFKLLLLLFSFIFLLHLHQLSVEFVLFSLKFSSHALSWKPRVMIRRE